MGHMMTQVKRYLCESNSPLVFGVTSAFLALFESLLDDQFEKKREFLRVAEPNDPGDSASSYLSKVRKGMPPPLDKVRAWARALKLDGEKFELFLDLADLANLPAHADGTRLRFEEFLLKEYQAHVLKSGSALLRAAELRWLASEIARLGAERVRLKSEELLAQAKAEKAKPPRRDS